MSVSPYYTYLTQRIANNFPSWMAIRTDSTSVGQQFLDAFGIQMVDVTRAFNSGLRGLFLDNADINVADVLQMVQLPIAVPLTPGVPPVVTGNGILITEEDDVDSFLYLDPPTRITCTQTTTNSTLTYTDVMPYDIPWVDQDNNENELSYQYNTSTNVLMKWREITPTFDSGYDVPAGTEVLGTYNLYDQNGNPITGTYHGACLYLDTMLMLFGQTLYVFDPRIPISNPLVSGWVGNQEVTSINAITSMPFSTTVVPGNTGLAFDPHATYFWFKNGNGNYYQFQLHYDYMCTDYTAMKVFFRESYNTTIINGNIYNQSIHNVWNYFDEFGLLLNTPRLLGESNQAYQLRLLSVMPFRSNSTVQGVVNAVSRDLSLEYYGYFPSGQQLYPSNIFPTGEMPSGYPIYASGIFPSGIYNIAKVNMLMDPVFYSGAINVTTGVPNAELADYTKEILSTFPIVWGSGSNDPIGFIWDLSPFDGGLNVANTVPEYFATANSGIPSDWYQSGVQDPTTQDLNVQIIRDPNTDNWYPQIWNGSFFIHNSPYYMYAIPGSEYIPSGVNPYNVVGSGTVLAGFPISIYDLDGTTAPSGMQYYNVTQFDNSSHYEFIYASGQILFNNPQNGLYLYYETNPSGWFTPPGFDFNPVHTGLTDGFLWVSNEQQYINPSGYTLTANPTNLSIGGGASILIGNLVDTTGEPITGAEVFFDISPSGFGSLSSTQTITDINGNAFSLYNSPTNVGTFANTAIAISGNSIIISGSPSPTVDLTDIWTLQLIPDISGYQNPAPGLGYPGGPIPTVWMSEKDTISLFIPASGWSSVQTTDTNYGIYQGVYPIGGTGQLNLIPPPNAAPGDFVSDDLFNIDVTSLNTNGTIIPDVTSGYDIFGLAYDIDNYAKPQTYGKLNVYTVIIPSGQTNVTFNTWAPVQPTSIQVNTPHNGYTTINYPSAVPSGVYEVYIPAAVTVESWATWQGASSLHQFATINMDFADAYKGVFAVDNKFLDFISYLRHT